MVKIQGQKFYLVQQERKKTSKNEDTSLYSLIYSNLSVKPSESAVFSRRFAYFVFQPYVFFLVFALTGRNKGKFLSK